MLEQDEFSFFFIPAIVVTILLSIVLIVFSFHELDYLIARRNYNLYNYSVQRATNAFSRSYNMDKDFIESISQGYLTSVDFIQYNKYSNSTSISIDLANRNFYKILYDTLPSSKTYLDSLDLYQIEVTTKFDLSLNKYGKVWIYRHGSLVDSANVSLNSETELIDFIERVIKIQIGKNIDFVKNLRKDFEVIRSNGDTNFTYSANSMYMTIGKNIMIKGLMSKNNTDIFSIDALVLNRKHK